MSLVFVDKYGAPDYGTRKGTKGIILHTTEGAGRTKAAALATAQWQASTGNTSGGSYNYLLGQDGDVVTAVRSVHPDHAAGGISTRRDSVWQPWAELTQFMGATAVGDPNGWVCQIAIQGQVSWFLANGYPKALVNAIAQLVKQLEARYGIPDIYLGAHYMFQTNRTDPGEPLIPLVIAEYNRLYRGSTAPAPLPQPVNTMKTVTRFPAPGATFRVGPAESPLNLFQITGWTTTGEPILKRYPAEATGIKWPDSSAGLATERRTWKGGDADGWLFCPSIWTSQFGNLTNVYISKAPLAEPRITITAPPPVVVPPPPPPPEPTIEDLKAELADVRDQLSGATVEIGTLKAKATALAATIAQRDTLITAKNAAIDKARAI